MHNHDQSLQWSPIVIGILIMIGISILAPVLLISIGVESTANIIGVLIGMIAGGWFAANKATNRPFIHAILVPIVYYVGALILIGITSLFT